MAKIVYACVRDVTNAALIKGRIESIIHKLVPDNIPDAKCKVVASGQIIYGISTYLGGVIETVDSVCVGMLFNSPEKWWKPTTEHPEGTYAIFRADEEYVEAITDIACSRAIWYYKDDMVFIAATSQRAVINVAGKFELERRNIPWILSSGTQAPSLSWCKNLRFVNPDGAVLLNRKTWELTTKSVKPVFPIAKIPDREHKHQFKKILLNSFNDFEFDVSKWILPISGGYDSRGIACLLKETGKDISRLNTFTWGNQASKTTKKSDGFLGGAVAKSMGMPHKFWATDQVNEPPEIVINRFILCSEGRIDHIAGYSDGMAIWKNIFDSGKHGIIRGDEPFGGKRATTFLRSRLIVGYTLCSDFSNLENYTQYGFEEQLLPEYLKEIHGTETPGLYRERLFYQYRLPVVLSALSDIKYAYTEVVNPFLARKIILRSRTLPDHLRNNKVLFAKIINEISPEIPYANEEATDKDILKTPEVLKMFSDEIGLDYMKELFPEKFLTNILTKLQKPSASLNSGMLDKLKIVISSNLPLAVKDNLRKIILKPALDISILAFRIYITGKTYKMFTEDVQAMKSQQVS